MGVVSLPSARSARSQTSPGRVSERQTLPLWGLAGGTPEERREPSGQRCAYARRCSEASRPRWAAQLYLFIGVFTFVKDLAGCCQYSSPITKGAADPNIRIGTLSGYDQNTPLPLKDPKAQCYASAHPCIAVHGASSVRVRLPPPERCAGIQKLSEIYMRTLSAWYMNLPVAT